MSRFFPLEIKCPACQEPITFSANSSLNADRRPDLRDQIVAGSFQRTKCPKCQAFFRLDPELNYLDVGRGQWLAIYPYAKINDWQTLEAESREAFDLAYGAQASEGAQEIGRDLKPRMVFGWSALREKIVALEKGLDDVELELLKIALVRGMDDPPLKLGCEIRFVDLDTQSGELVLVVLKSNSEAFVEELRVPRNLYDEIAADQEGWGELREELKSGYFVDMLRLMIATPAEAGN